MTVKTIRIKNKSSAEPSNEREVRLIIILLSLFASAMIFGAGSINLTDPSSETIKIIEYCLTTKNELSLFQIIFRILPAAIFLLHSSLHDSRLDCYQ